MFFNSWFDNFNCCIKSYLPSFNISPVFNIKSHLPEEIRFASFIFGINLLKNINFLYNNSNSLIAIIVFIFMRLDSSILFCRRLVNLVQDICRCRCWELLEQCVVTASRWLLYPILVWTLKFWIFIALQQETGTSYAGWITLAVVLVAAAVGAVVAFQCSRKPDDDSDDDDDIDDDSDD